MRRSASVAHLARALIELRKPVRVSLKEPVKDLLISVWKLASDLADSVLTLLMLPNLARGSTTCGLAAGSAPCPKALRTASRTSLGEQFALERHLVAPAFQASCTRLVR